MSIEVNDWYQSWCKEHERAETAEARAYKAERMLVLSAGHTCKGFGCECRYGQALAAKDRAETDNAMLLETIQKLKADVAEREESLREALAEKTNSQMVTELRACEICLRLG